MLINFSKYLEYSIEKSGKWMGTELMYPAYESNTLFSHLFLSRGCEFRFPSTSSYNRMLIHRTAAFFGMDHNVDSETQQCVIVAVTKGTRIPEVSS